MEQIHALLVKTTFGLNSNSQHISISFFQFMIGKMTYNKKGLPNKVSPYTAINFQHDLPYLSQDMMMQVDVECIGHFTLFYYCKYSKLFCIHNITMHFS